MMLCVHHIVFLSCGALKRLLRLDLIQRLGSCQYKSVWKWSVTWSLRQLRKGGNSSFSFFPVHIVGGKILTSWVTIMAKVPNRAGRTHPTMLVTQILRKATEISDSVTTTKLSLLWLIPNQYLKVHKKSLLYQVNTRSSLWRWNVFSQLL